MEPGLKVLYERLEKPTKETTTPDLARVLTWSINEVFHKMLDSSYTLLLGLFRKLESESKSWEFKTPNLEYRRTLLARQLA